jgi:hypothetical protein
MSKVKYSSKRKQRSATAPNSTQDIIDWIEILIEADEPLLFMIENSGEVEFPTPFILREKL